MSGGFRKARRRLYEGRRAFVHVAAGLALASLPAATAAQDVHILALGDSLTAGYGLPHRLGFAEQLQAHLRRHGVRAYVSNAGVSGDTAAQGLARLDWAISGMSRPPSLAIVELGANDMLRGLPPAQTRSALDSILGRLKARNMRLLLTGMVAAPNLGPDYAAAFNPIFPELAQRHGASLYPFFLDGVAGNRLLNQPDGIHPNFQGVKIIVQRITPAVIEALEE